MALWDEVKSRVSAVTLKQLTNVDLPAASSIDDTKGGYAATAAAAWFKRVSTATFDYTDADMLDIGIEATVWILRKWSGRLTQNLREDRETIEDSMRAYGTIGPRARITPKTTSPLTPTEEDANDTTVRPEFDNGRFDRVRMSDPPAP